MERLKDELLLNVAVDCNSADVITAADEKEVLDTVVLIGATFSGSSRKNGDRKSTITIDRPINDRKLNIQPVGCPERLFFAVA